MKGSILLPCLVPRSRDMTIRSMIREKILLPFFCRDTGCRLVCGAPVRDTPASFAITDDTATIALDKPLL